MVVLQWIEQSIRTQWYRSSEQATEKTGDAICCNVDGHPLYIAFFTYEATWGPLGCLATCLQHVFVRVLRVCVCVWMWIICVYRYMHVYLNVCGYVCTGILPLLLFITCKIVIKRKTTSTRFVMFKSAMFFSFNYFLFFMLHSAGEKMSPPLTWNGWRQA